MRFAVLLHGTRTIIRPGGKRFRCTQFPSPLLSRIYSKLHASVMLACVQKHVHTWHIAVQTETLKPPSSSQCREPEIKSHR